ncbi:MAG: TonB-dependent receptor [Bacteroidales bacterium]|jgi:hypothetical protein|nr:carboxypeptidase-like regulatory domain-containing protein [Bacteroidota bacterium]HHW58611.1 TonB-dependent receptor plug domain-containing protein [Bacteroidales bacterium]HOB78066.1 carboxypeptidase-like regulatory domain-containing protein [Bacteroidales bacterium]HPZ61301.1 carboxypeptidase-like regulatory domain-containing protein [Bacteroidales bacterium]HQD59004.1 carboxypeptidase-like regulatory domain-containing protein [Bacteroidales bacterium]
MRARLLSLVFLMLISFLALAQSSGTIMGTITEEGTNKPVPFAHVAIMSGERIVTGGVTDIDGRYKIAPVPPGTYNIRISAVSYNTKVIEGVVISPDKITYINEKISLKTEVLDVVEVVGFRDKPIDKGNVSTATTMTATEISKLPTRDAIGVAQTAAGVFKQDDGSTDVNIRGQRESGTVIYIDGIRTIGTTNLPKSALDQVTVITGGTPAEYGEATGGVINITTKSGSTKLSGGIELVTSQFLDPYGYNLLGFSLEGPLFKSKKDPKRSIFNFFLAGELSYEKDPRPFAKGLYKAKDDVVEYLEKNPLRPSQYGDFGAHPNAAFIRMKDLEHIKAKLNADAKQVNLSAKITVNTGPNIQLTFGGSFRYANSMGYVHSFSLFNWKNNPQILTYEGRAYVRFSQDFTRRSLESKDTTKKLISNIYYSLQADYSKINQVIQDPDFKDDLFKYGYVGKFTTTKARSYAFMEYYPLLDLNNVWVQDNFYDTHVDFEPGTANPALAAYTSRFYELYPDPAYQMNLTQIQSGNALLNGQAPESVYGLWSAPGARYNSYSKYDANLFGLSGKLNMDFGHHSLQVGFQYEQRDNYSIEYAPVGLWTLARQISNKHIDQLDTTNPILRYDVNGNFLDTIDFDRLYDANNQAFFDYNVRQYLGLPVDGTDWLDIDSYDPAMFQIDWFSADELLNNGNSYVAYYGYDYSGKKQKTRASFDDFFTQKDEYGNYTRPIPSFQPIYMAGYIQDKFAAFEDLIFNIGIRVDRFDANQKVLKDPFLFYEAHTLREVRQLQPEWDHPGNMGDDFVVYVDDIRNPSKPIGYRSGYTWYNAQGIEISDPTLLRTASGIAPYLVNPNLTHPTSAAFKDYDPQITVMPRIAFSFPISEEALFLAHYDIITKRPTEGLRLDPTNYYFAQTRGGSIFSNPALKPEKTIDYEVGFQQMIGEFSAIKLSTYYKEVRDLVQVYQFFGAYPIDYMSYNNIDFGTVKGFTITFDQRRSKNIWMKASYTLQFAEGTGSSATSGYNLISTGQPNLRTIYPLDYDQRHAFSVVFDFRYGSGKNYNGPVIKRKKEENGEIKVKETRVLENFGINVQFLGGSGTPYSRSSNVVSALLGGGQYILLGSINGSRMPWSFTVNLRIDKEFYINVGKKSENSNKKMYLDVYLEVLNLLNTKNIIAVYRATGNPDDDGYLSAPEYQAGIQAQLDEQAFRDLYRIAVDSPYNYSLPRRLRLGVQIGF